MMGKLGWYFETVEGWTTLLKDKEPYFERHSRRPGDIPTVDQRAELLRILNAHEPMLAALKEIAESPHRSYDNTKGDYGLGVADGHRFCANVAEDALAEAEGGSDGQN